MAAAAGEKHSLALATHGAVYSWGCGRHGQLGVPEVVHFQQNNPGVQPAMHTPQFVRALDPILMEPWDRSALHTPHPCPAAYEPLLLLFTLQAAIISTGKYRVHILKCDTDFEVYLEAAMRLRCLHTGSHLWRWGLITMQQ